VSGTRQGPPPCLCPYGRERPVRVSLGPRPAAPLRADPGRWGLLWISSSSLGRGYIPWGGGAGRRGGWGPFEPFVVVLEHGSACEDPVIDLVPSLVPSQAPIFTRR